MMVIPNKIGLLWLAGLAIWGAMVFGFPDGGRTVQQLSTGLYDKPYPISTSGILPEEDRQHFSAGGHLLKFDPDRLVMAGRDHAVTVDFAGANRVNPVVEKLTPADDPEGFNKVTYHSLWKDIDLVYEKTPQGIIKSSYVIAPGGEPSAIRLQYNQNVTINPRGELVVRYPTGEMVESPPVAWQEGNGIRKTVSVSYRQENDREIGFTVNGWDGKSRLIIDPMTLWHTFLGSAADDKGQGIAVDGSGNIYITGTSHSSWGSNIKRAYSWGSDAFVAKLSPEGDLLWNTFLGSAAPDEGLAVAVDGGGNVYVTGYSNGPWESPIRDFSSGTNAFVAKLDTNGVLRWNTFLGSSLDKGWGIVCDGIGNVYVTGSSNAPWGEEIKSPYKGNSDVFVAKLESTYGVLLWNTFLGSDYQDEGRGIAADGSGNVYITGYSSNPWGDTNIKRPHSGANDAFVAKVNAAGDLQWNTFLGSGNQDYGQGIAVDVAGNIFVTGESNGYWQEAAAITPIRHFSGNSDAFVAKLDGAGNLVWNTFLGSSSSDYGQGIAVDRIGNVFVSGTSYSGWTPAVPAVTVRPFSGNSDAFAAKLDGDGTLLWNTFLGSGDYDYGQGIAVDGSGNVCVTGFSEITWGTNPLPRRGFTAGGKDAFTARLSYNLLTFSGTVTHEGAGLAGVVLSGLPGSPVTATDGSYSVTVGSGWNGTVTPIRTGYHFDPVERIYSNVQVDTARPGLYGGHRGNPPHLRFYQGGGNPPGGCARSGQSRRTNRHRFHRVLRNHGERRLVGNGHPQPGRVQLFPALEELHQRYRRTSTSKIMRPP